MFNRISNNKTSSHHNNNNHNKKIDNTCRANLRLMSRSQLLTNRAERGLSNNSKTSCSRTIFQQLIWIMNHLTKKRMFKGHHPFQIWKIFKCKCQLVDRVESLSQLMWWKRNKLLWLTLRVFSQIKLIQITNSNYHHKNQLEVRDSLPQILHHRISWVLLA